jgi:hypothetical protein
MNAKSAGLVTITSKVIDNDSIRLAERDSREKPSKSRLKLIA